MARPQDRTTRMIERRERKFDAHNLEIREENHTDIRKSGEQDVTFDFAFAVYRGARLIGRTFTRRSALKRAHQDAHDYPVNTPKRKRR